MNNWKKAFSKTILSRGYDYYLNNKVTDFIREGNTCTATVVGTDLYTVEFKLLKNGKAYLTCDCPYAEDGRKCKHMAALLYKIDDMIVYPAQPTPVPPPVINYIKPFEHKTTTSNTYFDMSVFGTRLRTTADQYLKAKKLLNSGAFKLEVPETIHSSENKRDGVIICAQNIPGPGTPHTYLSVSRNNICGFMCDCSYKYQYYSMRFYNNPSDIDMCEHMTALALLLDEYITEYNPGDATDSSGALFIREIHHNEKTKKYSSTPCTQNLILQPRLELKYDNQLSVSFKIGSPKLYVLKNLRTFVKSVEKGDIYSFTKKFEINFANAEFEENSLKYFRFIRQYINNIDADDADESINNRPVPEIPLSGIWLDKFFDIATGSNIECTVSSYGIRHNSEMSFDNGVPKLEFTLTNLYNPANGWFEGVSLSGTLPETIKGGEYNYFADNDCLYRIDTETYEKLRPYYNASYYGDFRISIGQRNLSEFYYSVLPEIKKLAVVKEADKIDAENLLPPEVEFEFYLDLADGIPVCKAIAGYGDTKYNLAENVDAKADIYRNFYREELVCDTVKEYFPQIQSDSYCCTGDEDAIFAILQNGIKELLEHGSVHSTSRFDSLKVQRKMKITIGVSIQSNLMDLNVDTGDISRHELAEILNSYKLKKRYHRLKSGEFVNLDDTVGELYHIIEDLRISSKDFLKENIQVPTYRALYLDKMLEKYDSIYTNRDKQFRSFVKEFKTVSESDFEVPENLSNIMRDYQKFGHKWIRTVSESGFGGILADDMGLGKTLQIISVLTALKSEGNHNTSLVVCPASLVYNWQEEFAKYAPRINALPVVGTADERQAIIRRYNEYDVLITSYDLLKRDIAAYENITFEYEILDEAQNIKNHSTAASKATKVISANKRFALTGTPIENRLGELWSIFDYLMPGFLYGYDTFKKEFETPIIKNGNKDAAVRLKSMVTPFILRRLKKDVLKDLPDKTEEIRYAGFSPAQQQLYDAQAVHMMDIINKQSDESFNKGKLQILAELTKIRRICCDPSLVFENYTGESAKKETCLDLVETAIDGNHKVLLFSQFTSMLEILEAELNTRNISYYKITGETNKRERIDLVQKFNSDATPVFLISLKAGGTGLNLTGADVVIHYDPWWNVAAQNQATDRAHRIGQSKMVTVYKIIAKNTIEERIMELQSAKQDLADAVIGENTSAFSSLSKEDILRIIGV